MLTHIVVFFGSFSFSKGKGESMQLHSRKFVLALVLMLSVIGGWRSAHALCLGGTGYGSNLNCYNLGTCASYKGVAVVWCIRQTCAWGYGCPSISSATMGCHTGGCFNPFAGNCRSC